MLPFRTNKTTIMKLSKCNVFSFIYSTYIMLIDGKKFGICYSYEGVVPDRCNTIIKLLNSNVLFYFIPQTSCSSMARNFTVLPPM